MEKLLNLNFLKSLKMYSISYSKNWKFQNFLKYLLQNRTKNWFDLLTNLKNFLVSQFYIY